MSDTTADAAAPRPYGPLGLVVSIVLILIATLLLSAIVVAIIFAAGLGVLGHQQVMDRIAIIDPAGDPGAREKLGIIASLIGYAALALVIFVAARIRGGAGGWRDIIAWRAWSGWRSWRIWGLAVLMVGYSLAATTALTHFFPKFDAAIKLPDGKGWAPLFLLLAAVLAPLAEELLFRGWLYTSLRATFGMVAAILVVSVLFALAHWESTHLYALAVFPVGLGLALIRERTGTIKASILVHGLYNGIAASLLFVGK